jgi:hypothetical protein
MADTSFVGDPGRPKRIYSPARNWKGGYFELRLVFAEGAEDILRRALGALWSHPAVWGCVEDKWPEPALQPHVDPEVAAQVLDHPWYGVAELPNGVLAAVASFVTRGEGYASEVTFGVPMGALQLAYPVGANPFADGSSLSWRTEISDWMAEIGRAVFVEQPFRFGMIEHEVTGVEIENLTAVPETRWEGYLWPNNG